MKTLLEITEWKSHTPNHVYFVNDSRDRMFGYVPTGSGIPVKFSKPIRFDTKGRKFQAVPNQWAFSTESDKSVRQWSVTGSKGDTYTVSEQEGVLTCSCSGFRFRGKCRHVQEVAGGLDNL